MSDLNSGSSVVVSKNQISSESSGEAVILVLVSGTYFSLNAVGTVIWRLLQEPRTVQEICETIVRDYDVSEDRCRADVFRLLEDLERRGLIDARQD
jgi:hypothetical protein